MAVLLLALGVNKQLDLQTLLTEVGRGMAKAQGWYPMRQRYQDVFLGSVAVAGLAVLVVLGFLARRTLLRRGPALVGVVLLVCFVLVRAASFHHVDRQLGLPIFGTKLCHLIELIGSGIVACSGIMEVQASRRAKLARGG